MRGSDTTLNRPALALMQAAGIVGLLFAVFFCVATPSYETNDDSGMMALASGNMTGHPTEYIVCSNILIGRLLKWLYLSWPGLNWYSAYLYGVHFVSMTALLFALLVRHPRRVTVYLFLLLFLVLEVRFLLLLQFTSTSVVATTSGMALLMLVANVAAGRTKGITMLAGGGLLVIGALVRTNAFYLAGALSLPYLLYEWRSTRTVRSLVPLGAAALVSLACISYSHSVYVRDDAWAKFLEFNSARIRVHNYGALAGFIENDGNVKFVLDRLGWSANDLQLLGLWCYADAELFAAEKLSEAVDVFGQTVSRSASAVTYADHPFQLIELYVVFALLFSVLLLILLRQGGAAFVVVVAGLSILFTAAFLYLAVFASAPERVTLSALQATTAYVLFTWIAIGTRAGGIREPKELTLPGRSVLERGRALVLCGVVLALSRDVYLIARQHVDDNRMNARSHVAYEFFVDRLKRDFVAGQPGTGFVSWAGGLRADWAAATADCSDLSQLSLIRFGWTLLSPHYDAMLARNSVDNVFAGMLENPRLFLLCTSGMQKYLITYIEEHLHKQVSVVDHQIYWFEDEAAGVPRVLSVRKVVPEPSPSPATAAMPPGESRTASAPQ